MAIRRLPRLRHSVRFLPTAAIVRTAVVWMLATAGIVLSAGATAAQQPTLQSRDGRSVLVPGTEEVHVEHDGQLVARWSIDAETHWSTVASLRRGWVAAGVVSREERSALTVLVGETSSFRVEPTRALPVPPAGGRLARDPVLLIEQGRLAGLAWLTGGDLRTLEVRGARWDGTAWGPVERIAGRAAGSQVALTGDVLEDGSWLVAWAAYDGGDTEILWSRRVGGAWSAAASLHEDNAVHDIVPELIASPGGALAAWSRFDGHDYRLLVARFDGLRWRMRPFVGGRGSLRPAFVRDGQSIYLLHRVVTPPVWTVSELDDEGRLLRQAVVSEDTTERPLLYPNGGPEAVLRWPGPDDTARERRASWESHR